MASADLIHRAQVREARRADLAPVRPLAAITHDKHTHLALRRLDRTVSLSWWNSISFGIEEEVVNQRLHVLLHRRARRRHDLVILHLHGTRRHLIQALVNDPQTLPELLHPTQVPVIAISIHANRDVEFDFVVGVVGLGLADVPGYAGASEHDAREGVVKSVSSADDAYALGAPYPDPIVGKELLGLIDAVAELGCPLVDVVEQTEGKILADAAWTNVGSMEASARDSLVEFLEEVLRMDTHCRARC